MLLNSLLAEEGTLGYVLFFCHTPFVFVLWYYLFDLLFLKGRISFGMGWYGLS